MLRGLGCEDVATFRASGNVVFSAEGEVRTAAHRVEKALRKSLGYDVGGVRAHGRRDHGDRRSTIRSMPVRVESSTGQTAGGAAGGQAPGRCPQVLAHADRRRSVCGSRPRALLASERGPDGFGRRHGRHHRRRSAPTPCGRRARSTSSPRSSSSPSRSGAGRRRRSRPRRRTLHDRCARRAVRCTTSRRDRACAPPRRRSGSTRLPARFPVARSRGCARLRQHRAPA